MKQLYIVRHGKSDWQQGVSDFDRPLNPRGKKNAPDMGKFLKANHTLPQFVLSSTANRAISTTHLVLHAMGIDFNLVKPIDNLYLADVPSILEEVAKVSDSVDSLYVFGHNPGLSDLVYYLSGEPAQLKTCCVAILDLQVDSWSQLSRETCVLSTYLSPKEI